MTPFEYTHVLSRITDRLHTALIAAVALFGLALATLGARLWLGAVSYPLAAALVACSGLACGVALGAAWYAACQRGDVYDAIVLARFRHVGGDAVRRHAEKLVDLRRRKQMARAIRRVIETTDAGLPSPVPVNRRAVAGVQPRLELLATQLSSGEREVNAHGMVLVRRLITNGAGSPLYYHDATERSLDDELDRIERELWVDVWENDAPVDLSLAA